MKRKIKFRVWSSNQNKMVYFDMSNIVNSADLLDQPQYPVQQCTDLEDKNGKEIYEGDIIRITEFDPAECRQGDTVSYTAVVYYENGYWRTTSTRGCYGGYSEEVVGHVYNGSDNWKDTQMTQEEYDQHIRNCIECEMKSLYPEK